MWSQVESRWRDYCHWTAKCSTSSLIDAVMLRSTIFGSWRMEKARTQMAFMSNYQLMLKFVTLPSKLVTTVSPLAPEPRTCGSNESHVALVMESGDSTFCFRVIFLFISSSMWIYIHSSRKKKEEYIHPMIVTYMCNKSCICTYYLYFFFWNTHLLPIYM